MPIFLKAQFICETGAVCTPNKGAPYLLDWSIQTAPTVIDLEQALKQTPPGWDRKGKDGALRCSMCVKGPPDLSTVG
jgi:hypothetical protein